MDSAKGGAVLSSSGLYVFGDNSEGNLGIPDVQKMPNSPSPLALGIRTPVRFVSVAAGLFHSLALTIDGKVWSWGRAENGRLGLGLAAPDTKEPQIIEAFGQTQVAVIAAGYHHSMALSTKSQLFCWGSGWSGQLGTGSNLDLATPQLIDVPTAFDKSGKLTRLAAGYHHSLALTDQGRIYSWGYGEVGQLGHGTQNKRCGTPTLIESCASHKLISIAASENHSVALSDDGKVFTWGYNKWKQLGHNLTSPTDTCQPNAVPSDQIFTKITAGSSHTLAISKEGKLYYWGRLVLSSDFWEQPKVLEALKSAQFSDVSSRLNHVLALTKAGEIWSFGYNEYGQCGQAHFKHAPLPAACPTVGEGLNRIKFVSVIAGGNHSIAISAHESLQSPSVSSEDNLKKSSFSNQRSPKLAPLTIISSHNLSDLAPLNTNLSESTPGVVSPRQHSNSPKPTRISVSKPMVPLTTIEQLTQLFKKEQELRAEKALLQEQQAALNAALAEWNRKDEELATERLRVFREAGLM